MMRAGARGAGGGDTSFFSISPPFCAVPDPARPCTFATPRKRRENAKRKGKEATAGCASGCECVCATCRLRLRTAASVVSPLGPARRLVVVTPLVDRDRWGLGE